ncbi:MAG: sugar ABC transporter ATP-binding protein [Streptosporangiaceae bacterium]
MDDRTGTPAIALEAISKRYGANEVLHGVDFAVATGSCVALVGENGAGKSTLVKIMAGVIPPTAGAVRIFGEEHRLPSPHDARHLGIGLIPQELAYVPTLSVAENVVLGEWPTRFWTVDWRRVRARARAVLADVGLDIDVRLQMSQLTLAERQLVEVAKAVAANFRVLVFDEPTAALNAADARRLLAVVSRLVASGRSVVYVSHRLEECLAVADRVVILRNGSVAANSPASELSIAQLVSAMVGDRAAPQDTPAEHLNGSSPAAQRDRHRVLIGRELRPARKDSPNSGVTIELLKGEVVGLFGLIGAGATAVAQALAGAIHGFEGSLEYMGVPRPLYRGVHQAVRDGVVYIPAERKSSGLALGLAIAANVTIGSIPTTKSGMLRPRLERRLVRDLLTSVAARYQDVRQTVGELSGGNQQKVLIASRLAMAPRVLIAEEPTRGVDVAARAQIHALIREAASSGMAVLVVSSDAHEICELADRVLAIRSTGQAMREFSGDEIRDDSILAWATAADTGDSSLN